MGEEMQEENNGIVKAPEMSEKELMDIVKNLKNGKAAGVDGIRAELMKSLINKMTPC